MYDEKSGGVVFVHTKQELSDREKLVELGKLKRQNKKLEDLVGTFEDRLSNLEKKKR